MHTCKLVLVVALCVGLSFEDENEDGQCRMESFSTAADFDQCLEIIVGNIAAENFAFVPKAAFNASAEALISLTFTSSPLDVTACSCTISYEGASVKTVPNPRLNEDASAVDLRGAPSVKFLYGAGNASPATGKYALLMLGVPASLSSPGLHWLVRYRKSDYF